MEGCMSSEVYVWFELERVACRAIGWLGNSVSSCGMMVIFVMRFVHVCRCVVC
jgi:hypothetical protein